MSLKFFNEWYYTFAYAPTYTRQLKNKRTMSNYSKAPRGLFVLIQLGRVFTATAISPSRSLRQLLARYAFRAGRNLPDKELRYRRTVIVTAAVYRSLNSWHLNLTTQAPILLTYRHWASVSPYTSAFAFAGTCVFDKQSTSKL